MTMMSTAEKLRQAMRGGLRRIGELEIQPDLDGHIYVVTHIADAELAQQPALGGLDFHEGPSAAHELSTYAEDGSYRFAKGQTNLRRGWAMALRDEEELRQALDGFYPAALGLWFAHQAGELEVQHLRPKLERQTGMYRFAKKISDEGAQRLVQEVCGPAHACARKILWQLDESTPLEDSEASRYDGIPHPLPDGGAIPLLCREACNHFVAECRKASKAEADGAGA